MTQFTPSAEQKDKIVYIRQVVAAELPVDAKERSLYSIHDGEGRRIGVAPDRNQAFLAARQHKLQPVSVH